MLPDENEERFFDYSLRVRYKPRVSSWEKFTLATTLYTWSPNEVAHCLVSLVGTICLWLHVNHLTLVYSLECPLSLVVGASRWEIFSVLPGRPFD
jgi:hypothetical protein